MIGEDIVLTPEDEKAIALLDGFLPEKIFDMHMHIGNPAACPNMWKKESIFDRCGVENTMDTYMRHNSSVFGNRKLRANMILFPDRSMADPDAGSRSAAMKLLLEQLEKHPQCVGEIMVCPGDSTEDLENMLSNKRIVGFKCYHTLTGRADSFQCCIGEYLPESAWQVAQKYGLCITLHMVRREALADPENFQYICAMAKKYPNAKLILAHAARGFAAWTVMETVEQLANYPNIYFDLSGICEPAPIFAVIRKCGHKRVFWGSDYPVSLFRGKCVSVGPDFLWLYKQQLEACTGKTDLSAYLVGIENLLAVRTACRMLELGREEIEDIFYNNAMNFFGLVDE